MIGGLVSGLFGIGGSNQSRKEAKHAQMRAEAHAAAQRAQADKFLEQVPGVARGGYDPYIQQGNTAQGLATEQYNRMTTNPMDYINQITEGYKPSTGYNFREKRALEAARNSAAQGGLSGTQVDQGAQSELVNGLLGQDMQEWLNNVLGVQGAGLSGQQHLSDRGYNASQNLTDILANALSERAGIATDRAVGLENKAMQHERDRADAGRSMRQGIGSVAGQGAGALAGLIGGGMGGGAGSMGDLGSLFGGILGGGGRGNGSDAGDSFRGRPEITPYVNSRGMGGTATLTGNIGRRGFSPYGGFR